MENRLRRKAELQKQAAQPVKFQDSLQKEMEKKKDFKAQSQAERREALCAELGRGC